jgi:hypothetical protein
MTDANARFYQVMEMVLEDATMEADIRGNAMVKAPAIERVCQALLAQLAPQVEALHAAHGAQEKRPPADYIPEAVAGLLQAAFDYGFRAGRIFEARDYGVEIPEEADGP